MLLGISIDCKGRLEEARGSYDGKELKEEKEENKKRNRKRKRMDRKKAVERRSESRE